MEYYRIKKKSASNSGDMQFFNTNERKEDNLNLMVDLRQLSPLKSFTSTEDVVAQVDKEGLNSQGKLP